MTEQRRQSVSRPSVTARRLHEVLEAVWAINMGTSADASDFGGRAGEQEVYYFGKRAGWWSERELFRELRTLTDEGLLVRQGERGGYHYTLSDAGRKELDS